MKERQKHDNRFIFLLTIRRGHFRIDVCIGMTSKTVLWVGDFNKLTNEIDIPWIPYFCESAWLPSVHLLYQMNKVSLRRRMLGQFCNQTLMNQFRIVEKSPTHGYLNMTGSSCGGVAIRSEYSITFTDDTAVLICSPNIRMTIRPLIESPKVCFGNYVGRLHSLV